jgi:small redox-active disulfide protein 2
VPRLDLVVQARRKPVKKLQVLGTGCPKCRKLAENTEKAAKALGIDYELVKVTSLDEIMKFGVLMTPALAIDGVVKVVGKVPEPETIQTLLK